MIVLPINNPNEEDDTPQEWSLLELNGELCPAKIEPSGDEMEFGLIQFDSEGSAKLTIGAHELKGKTETLKQPFVVMRPCKRKRCNETKEESTDKKSGYEIAGIIKSKILFGTYPKSIMR